MEEKEKKESILSKVEEMVRIAQQIADQERDIETLKEEIKDKRKNLEASQKQLVNLISECRAIQEGNYTPDMFKAPKKSKLSDEEMRKIAKEAKEMGITSVERSEDGGTTFHVNMDKVKR